MTFFGWPWGNLFQLLEALLHPQVLAPFQDLRGLPGFPPHGHGSDSHASASFPTYEDPDDHTGPIRSSRKNLPLSRRLQISNLNSNLNSMKWCLWEVSDFLLNLRKQLMAQRDWAHLHLWYPLLLFIKNGTLNPSRFDFRKQIGSLIWLSTTQTCRAFPQALTTPVLTQVTIWINITGYIFGISI